MTIRRGAIVGLGLIGSSLGAALRRRGVEITGHDADTGRQEISLRLGHIDHSAAGLEDALADDPDFIVLALPVGAILDLVPRTAAAGPQTTILDTGSVKAPVVAAMNAVPEPHRFIGGHPLAGRETSGPEGADPDLFQGRPFVLTSTGHTGPLAQRTALEILLLAGAYPVFADADQHDRVLARTSHLPQLVATALASCLQPGDEELAGPALAEMTRIAASDPTMWRDILLANRENVSKELQLLVKQLEAMAASLEEGDAAAIEAAIDAGGKRSAVLRREIAV